MALVQWPHWLWHPFNWSRSWDSKSLLCYQNGAVVSTMYWHNYLGFSDFFGSWFVCYQCRVNDKFIVQLRLGRTALYCYSESLLGISCISFFMWKEMVVEGGLKMFIEQFFLLRIPKPCTYFHVSPLRWWFIFPTTLYHCRESNPCQ